VRGAGFVDHAQPRWADGKGEGLEQEMIVVPQRGSTLSKVGHLVVSARKTSSAEADLVVGRPGMPNVTKSVSVGDAILFETPDAGVLEVRVMWTEQMRVKVLVTQVTPHPGIAAGFVEDEDVDNTRFTAEELRRVEASLDEILESMSIQPGIRPEQIQLLSRKLDALKAASSRYGRKDWLNLFVAVLTNLMVAAAFSPEASSALFKAAKTALAWLIGGLLQLPG
jgi:hypothetical protein